MDASVLICDYAQVHQGKLYVTGGGVNLLLTSSPEPPHVIDAYAAIVIAVPWQAHNQAHKLAIRLITDDGAVIPLGISPADTPEDEKGQVIAKFNVGKPAIMQVGDDTLFPLAIPLRLGLPGIGGHRLIVEVDGTKIGSAHFRVIQGQHPM